MIRFIETMIHKASIYLLAWTLLRFDRRHGGKHQNLIRGGSLVTVGGKMFSLRWLLVNQHIPSDESSRYEQLRHWMDRAEGRGKLPR